VTLPLPSSLPWRRRSGRALFLLASALPLAACRQDPPAAPDVVAQFDKTEIRYSEFERYLSRTVGDTDSVLQSEVLSQLFDQFLDEILLHRLAQDRKIALPVRGDPGGRGAIEALLMGGATAEPREAEIRAYYDAHAAEFTRPERVRLRQILAENKKSADEALGQLKRGTEFEEVAQRLSRDPSAASGGDQGELAQAELPPSFAAIIFALKPGEVSRPVAADYGFHIFQVVERLPAGVVPFELARPEIARRLRQERGDELLKSLVKEARGRYHIRIYERNLPFGYEGAYLEAHAKKAS
jgi:peptidyl-prolyl cis-trans isomerase C